jgi:hypothetical protein
MESIATVAHQIIYWLGYLAMFAFVAFTILSSLYYIGVLAVRLIRRIVSAGDKAKPP